MIAKLVYDESHTLWVPNEMGVPAVGQLVGHAYERMTEVAGRICYDSLGRGRSSLDYHKHINEVNHGSVQEHVNLTVSFADVTIHRLIEQTMLNRPGCWTVTKRGQYRVTANLRAIREWNSRCPIGRVMKYHAQAKAPMIFELVSEPPNVQLTKLIQDKRDLTEEEQWITLYMRGSRGFSHEQVRHKWRTAVSQRSTRYVDESESEWIKHPLLEEFLQECGSSIIDPSIDTESYYDVLDNVEMDAKAAYDHVVRAMQTWLMDRGESKLTARKQARGAARGFLGNALSTEMIFSASVAQWKRMIAQRANPAADAEIRDIYTNYVIPCLRNSQYGDAFDAKYI